MYTQTNLTLAAHHCSMFRHSLPAVNWWWCLCTMYMYAKKYWHQSSCISDQWLALIHQSDRTAHMATQHSGLTSCSIWERQPLQTRDCRWHMADAQAQSPASIRWQTWHDCREMLDWQASATAALVLTTAGSTFSCTARRAVCRGFTISCFKTVPCTPHTITLPCSLNIMLICLTEPLVMIWVQEWANKQ